MNTQGASSVVPAIVESGEFSELVDEGQTISLAQSPLDGSLGIFVVPTHTAVCQFRIAEWDAVILTNAILPGGSHKSTLYEAE
jgi:hypothetical protein